MPSWSSVLPARFFRRTIGAPRGSPRSSIQDQVMERAVRFVQGHWEAAHWAVLFDKRRQEGTNWAQVSLGFSSQRLVRAP